MSADGATGQGGLRRAPDAFPHTRRPLPWALAAFVVMLFLIPIDSTELKVHLPVDSHVDRFAILGLVLAWFWFGGDQRAFLRTPRSKLYVAATAAFAALAVASLLFDAGRIINLQEFTLAEKRFGLLASFLIVSWFALTALRFEDLRGFASLLIGLGTVLAVGMIVERKTGYNVFYIWSNAILKPIATVAPSPTDIHPAFGSDGRVFVVGPTLHGLAAATMLVMVIPFALVRMLNATSRKDLAINATAFLLMFGGAMATDKKTALVVPVAAILYIAVYRRRQLLRYAPLGVVLVVGFVHFAAPGALGTTLNLSSATTSNSTTHRVGDFSALVPDITARPLLGRGYGTFDIARPDLYRINDNQYLDALWEVGVLGLLAYIWMILAPVVAARRGIKSRDPAVASLALATSAGCVAFFVASGLFDAFSYPQSPYMFFCIAAMTTVAASGPRGTVEPLLSVERRRGPLPALAGGRPARVLRSAPRY